MADILLIYPCPGEIKHWRFGFSLKLLYLSAILKQAGHRVIDYLDYSIEKYDPEKFHTLAAGAEVLIIEFDAFPLKRTINIEHGETLVKLTREKFPCKKIIVFGYDFALFPRSLENADFTLTGEPEKNILPVVDIVLCKKRCSGTFEPQVLENLDELPFPDRDLLTPFAETGGSIISEPHLPRSTLIETSRGCLGRCRFCQRRGWSRGFRAHSVDYVAREFAAIAGKNYRNIWISDDNFTYDLKRAKAILKVLDEKKLTRRKKIALSSWANIDEEFLELARSAGVSIISFGVESADEDILKFYEKHIDLKKLRDLIRKADRIGLYTVGNFIFGAPMESEATIEKTFAYIRETPFDQLNLKILDYMAGSELYNSLPPHLSENSRHVFACRENGLNRFPLRYLGEKLAHFRREFALSRQERLKAKIGSFGPPYFVRGASGYFD
ncbi:MAG: B12-binding domain-containing radical SAM protein [Candidatus Aminicenantes bacterium]|nr:B12-binding domain-containing radical SAM protein [Candidatus Aminicenantes bacterium]